MPNNEKKIRTMKSDISDFSGKPSFQNSKVSISVERRSGILSKIIIALVIILVLAGGGWYAYYKFFSPEAMRSPDEALPQKLINASEEIIKLSSSQDLLLEIPKIPKTDPGTFKVLHISEIKNGGRHFLTPIELSIASGLHIPAQLFSSIKNYNFGIVGEEDKTYPFLIFSLSSLESSREGILLWEKYMPRELSGIFPDLKKISFDEKISFRSGVIKNQDIRILTASSTELAYSFYNQKYLILTSSQKALSEIISRYSIFPPN